MITIACENCFRTYNVKSALIGKRVRCKECGQEILVADTSAPTPELPAPVSHSAHKRKRARSKKSIDVREVLSSSWAIFVGNLADCFLATIFSGIVAGMVIVFGGFVSILLIGAARAMRHGGALNLPMFYTGLVFLALWLTVFLSYFTLGLLQYFIAMARGKKPRFRQLFGTSRYVLTHVLCTIVVTVLVGVGFMLLIVPGLIISLRLWPYQYLIVDKDLPNMTSLFRAAEITKDNLLESFLLALIVFVSLVGVVTSPFALLTLCVAYCRMTKQSIAGERRVKRGESRPSGAISPW